MRKLIEELAVYACIPPMHICTLSSRAKANFKSSIELIIIQSFIVRYGRSSINSLVIGRTIYILACREYLCNNQNIGITKLNIEHPENENQFQ